ncbi:premnaspirodiene oxygenase [Forsythia ovata]|uniref:Premnaspirodiene oxygenase n=1 Tax=Forsythia ovata TaxID=205694 RepID=A0ABD1RNH4_9LAMI
MMVLKLLGNQDQAGCRVSRQPFTRQPKMVAEIKVGNSRDHLLFVLLGDILVGRLYTGITKRNGLFKVIFILLRRRRERKTDLAKTYGPIMQLQLGELPILVISSAEIAKSVLKDHDPCFVDRPQAIALKIMWYDYIDIAFAPYGNYWRQMRKICII